VHPTEDENCDTHGVALDDYVALRDALLAGVARKTDVVCHLLDQGPWDLFLTVFCESHCANHQCWHLHDPTHDRHDPAIAHATGDVLELVYVALDRALAEILEHLDDDTTVIVLASHSAGPHYDASFMLDRILRALESADLSSSRRLMRRATAATQAPLRWFSRFNQHSRDRLWRGFEGLPPLDPASGRYFKIDNNEPWGGVRINVVGREPAGKVRQGAEFDVCCEQLARDLLDLVNVETGQPLARRVVRTDTIFKGDRLDMLPDLVVEWENTVPVRSVWSPKTGRIDAEYTYIRTGDHRLPGLVLVRGPGIVPGTRDPIQTMDLAPTIAALLDTRLDECEGRVAEGLLARAPT
jgi:predicted AlkP superfamily phosphohydrolase/phosphomutase